jgi:GAF domain-containing protein
MNQVDASRCPLQVTANGLDAATSDLGNVLEESGWPLVDPVQERLRFETLLAELSATFVNLYANQVDSQIESALQRLVMFLGTDRGALAELLIAQKQMVITHSYHTPAAPPHTRIILDERLPWYTRAIYQGEVLRFSALPDDLPPEAVQEREYCIGVGLKSDVMIPLKVMGSVVGAIGFGSFSGKREWPDELIQRLRLVGEIFTNALARKRAEEDLRAREQSLRQAREGVRRLAARLLHA